MTKSEVGLIVLKVTADGREAFHMKIYRDGTTCRYGAGGLPRIGISGMSLFGDARFFDPLLELIPGEVLEHPMNYEEETPNGYLEYVLAFYGVAANGETGEGADWTLSTGIRLKLDQQTTFSHPLLGLLDKLSMDAAELTNEWYFDIMIYARYGMLSNTLPRQTMVTQPKTVDELERDFGYYVNQMKFSSRKWRLKGLEHNKTYERDGKRFRGIVQEDGNTFGIDFVPLAEAAAPGQAEKRKWWKFW